MLAFPDEDVLIGTRFTTPAGFEAFKALNDVVPRPDHKASGEERAWGRRLAKRFGVDTAAYDDRSFMAKGNGNLPEVLDHESLKPESDPGRRGRLLQGLRRQAGRLARGLRLGHGRRPRQARVATVPLDARSRPSAGVGWCEPSPPTPVDPAVVDGLVDLARRAPSAGNSQGVAFVVLEGAEQTARYWDVALPAAKRGVVRLAGPGRRAGADPRPRAPDDVGRALRRARQGRPRPRRRRGRLAGALLVGRRRHGGRSTSCSGRSTRASAPASSACSTTRRPSLAGLGVPDGWRAARHHRPRPPGARTTRASRRPGRPRRRGRRGPPPRRAGDRADSLSRCPAVAELTNRRVLLARRPEGLVREDDFAHDEAPVPEPADGEVLVRTEWIGIDATVRTWLSKAEGYIPPVEIGEVVRSSGIGRVIASRSDGCRRATLVATLTGMAGVRGGRRRPDAHRRRSPRAPTRRRPWRSSAPTGSPPTSASPRSARSRRARRSWCPRPPAPPGRSPSRSPRSSAAG